ncbi:hypothetical protein LWC34_53495 [Kibdelosporangium philippinense]|uniref:Glycosyl hydrolases family 43 n=1 Tax=Kibdelosporangium philippinense TaxID=211113 RepID=A0ABS8ZV52_9PSEU|nr:hypothetical protein [Kibdelosporangium philippinense]MCE7011573.1 hypothetical protein [Kibdelosporangium philippinense]
MQQLVFGGNARKGLSGLRNLDTVADPSVTWRGDRWWMVLGGTHGQDRVIKLFTAESTVANDGWRIMTAQDDPGLAVQLADAPTPDGWDATGYHCPAYARGRDASGAVVERIYYASSSSFDSLYGPYQIGYLQLMGDDWVRRPEPVFTASEPWERGTVLEPNVLFCDGRWLLRYTAGLATGALAMTGLVESPDGVSGWRRIGAPEARQFDAHVIAGDHGFDLIISRHPLDSKFTPDDGLWHSRGENPDGPWNPAQQLVSTIDGTDWHQSGVWKPTAVRENGRLVVFSTVAQPGENPYVPALGIGMYEVSAD